jgi:Protein of unknown function (DUF4242)
MTLQRFIIERDLPAIGSLEREQLRPAIARSKDAMRRLGPDIQWAQSYVSDHKSYCVYLASDEAVVRKHAEMAGLPVTRIVQINSIIDPATERPE